MKDHLIIMCHNDSHAVRSLLPAIPPDPFLPSGPKKTEKDEGLMVSRPFSVLKQTPFKCYNMIRLGLLYKTYKPRMVVQTLKDLAALLIPQVNC